MNYTQKNLLESLKILLEVFNQNNIEYFAIGGTALGAYRHKGFIPWDDDIDIGIPRYYYDKLIDLIKDNKINLPSNKFVSLEIDKKHNYLFMKFINIDIPIIENSFPDSIIGLYIDIFPIDGCSNNINTARKHIKKINNFSKLFTYKKMKWQSLKGIRRLIKFMTYLLPSKLIYNHISRLQRKYSFSNSKYVANTVGAWKSKEIQEAFIFRDFSDQKFENLTIKCPSEIDIYLSSLYGNYMAFPPKDKQVSHHSFNFLKKESEDI